jgi:hypothetical protein
MHPVLLLLLRVQRKLVPFFDPSDPYFVELELPRPLNRCSGYLRMVLVLALSRVRFVDDRKSL